MFIFGTEKGLTQFQAVNSGSAANATANAMLSSAVADTGGKGFLRVAGVFDDNMKQMMAAQMPAMASLNTFALAADYSNDFLSFALVMSAEDAAALEQMKMMMDAQLPMVAQMDSSGALSEIVSNLKTEIVGNKMTITTGLSKATLDKLIEQFGAMVPGMAQQ